MSGTVARHRGIQNKSNGSCLHKLLVLGGDPGTHPGLEGSITGAVVRMGEGLRRHTGQGLTWRSSTHTVSVWVRVRGAQADREEGAVLQPALS